MWSIAFAQATQAPSGPPFIVQMFPMIVIVGIIYFLIFRPQQKRTRELREMLEKLKKNDEVVTGGGIYGKVISLTDTVVTLEVAQNVRIRVGRANISQLVHAKGDKGTGKEVKAK